MSNKINYKKIKLIMSSKNIRMKILDNIKYIRNIKLIIKLY